MNIIKAHWKLVLVVTAVSLGCLLFSYFRSDAGAEEKLESSFLVNSIKFRYYPPITQPLPKIVNGVALDEYIPMLVKGFYLTETAINQSDFPDFFDMLGTSQTPNMRGYPFTSLEFTLFIRYMNENHAPELAQKGTVGYFAMPTWEDITRVHRNGSEPKEPLMRHPSWDPFHLANRFSEHTTWDGTDIGRLAVGGSSIRRERLQFFLQYQYFSFPSKSDIDRFKETRILFSDSYMGYSRGPSDVIRTKCPIRLKFVKRVD